jgi:hypothetical protein
MVGEIAVPDRYELGTLVVQDLARGSVFMEILIENFDGISNCWRIE